MARRAARAKRRIWGLSGIAGKVLLIAVAVALVPVALTLLYLLPFVHPPSTLMMRDAVTLRGYDRQWVDLEDIAPVLVASVIMSEDGQFCSHRGIDWGALNEVLDGALAGESTRGASTIPMQTVKNLYLWQGRSFLRKVMEAPLALGFDAVTPKKRIMEIYLNIVEWAPGVYGAQAAAQHHFGVDAKDLTRRQAALLAVTLPNPHERDPAKPSRGLTRLAGLIEKRAQQAGSHIRCVRFD